MEFILVGAARPNFVKLAPLARELGKRQVSYSIVHVGQHYDWAMSGSFFKNLNIPEPVANLDVGSGTHGEQTGHALIRFEKFLLENYVHPKRKATVVVFGDVNCTLAAALAATKLHIPVVHVEAGLRSFDRTMPEEINRVLVDRLADELFVTEQSGVDNLAREAITSGVHLVGNLMVDSLFSMIKSPEFETQKQQVMDKLGLRPKQFALVTLHRPAIVDFPEKIRAWVNVLEKISEIQTIVFPVHPRTRRHLPENLKFIQTADPMEYPDCVGLMSQARWVLTDSGGVQEETSALGVPCFTARDNTERPVTIQLGTNKLVGTDPRMFLDEMSRFNPNLNFQRIPLWDGHAAERIVDVLAGATSRMGVAAEELPFSALVQ